MLITVVGAAVKVFCFCQHLFCSSFSRKRKTYSLVRSNSSGNSNRRRIGRSLYQIPRIDICSSPSTNIRQSFLDARITFSCISGNVDTSRDLNQARPSAAWRVGLLRAGRNGAAGGCGACVDNCCAGPGFEGAGEIDGFGADYGVGGDCNPACGLEYVSLAMLH